MGGVFWQIGFGNDLSNPGTGSAGTGISGKSSFTGNDSGGLPPEVLDAHALDVRFPAGAVCLGSNNWANAGVDGCCDNPRADSFTHGGYAYAGDDDALNPYFGTYLAGIGYPGYYSTVSLMDYPIAVLLKTTDGSYFAVAAVANMDRVNDGSGGDGPCAATPGTNPGPCDARPGFFSFAEVADGLSNAIDPNRSNVIPWQATPAPSIDESAPVDPNDPNSALILDVSWSAAHLHSDASFMASTNPTMGPTDPNSASGVGVEDIAARFGGLVRYVLEVAPESDPNFSNPTSTTETTGTAVPDLVVPAGSCLRVRTLFGKKPQTQTHSLESCRLGRCGDIGYEVRSAGVCPGEESASPPGQGGSGGSGESDPAPPEGDPPASGGDTSTGGEGAFAKIEPEIYDAVAAEGVALVHVVLMESEPFEVAASMPDLEAYRLDIAAAQETFLATLPGGVFINYQHRYAYGFAAYINATGIEGLEAHQQVKWVYLDRKFVPTLTEGLPLVGADQLHAIGITGLPTGSENSIPIAVLDTGIDWRHEALGGCFGAGCKVLGGADCTPKTCVESRPECVVIECCSMTEAECNNTPNCVHTDPNNPTDPNLNWNCCDKPYCEDGTSQNTLPGTSALSYHGTAVAGITAAKAIDDPPVQFLMDGMAPDASLVAVRVFDPVTGDSSELYGEVALDWVILHLPDFGGAYGIKVVNMSFGSLQTYSGDPNDLICTNTLLASQIGTLVNNRVAVVVSSGNSRATNGVSHPACVPAATAVATSYDEDFGDEDPNCSGLPANPADPNSIWCGSNTGMPLDLVAPGTLTDTTGLTNGGADPDAVQTGFAGTSAAAPYVAGAFALMFGECPPPPGQGNPTVATLEARLEATGLPVRHKGGSTTWPRIDVAAAMRPTDGVGTIAFASPSNPNLLSWTALTGATRYDVYRGQNASGSPWSFNHTCKSGNQQALNFTDTQTPPAGAMYYYLVAASSCILESGVGSESDGTPRPIPSPCP